MNNNASERIYLTRSYGSPLLTSAGIIERGLIFLACASILLPVHPSFQSVLITYAIPSYVVSMAFALPLLCLTVALNAFILSNQDLQVLLLLAAYIFWLLFVAIFSPAIGQLNYFSSLRSILILMPLALMSSVIASRNAHCAAVIIIGFGLVATIHLFLLTIFFVVSSDFSGFKSLSSDPDKQNYQSTSFYIGFVGVGLYCAMCRSRGVRLILFTFAFFLILSMMAFVGARSSILALCISFATILIALRIDLAIRVFVCILSTVSLVFLIFWFGLVGADDLLSNFLVIERFLTLIDNDDSSGRIFLFSSAVSMWMDSPKTLLFGGGLGAFPLFIEHSSEGWYPHNFILESFAEGGLVAGLIIIALGFMLMKSYFTLGSRHWQFEISYLGSLALYSFLSFQFMGGLQSIWIPIFFITLFIFSNPKS